jgi:hypothetical protein
MKRDNLSPSFATEWADLAKVAWACSSDLWWGWNVMQLRQRLLDSFKVEIRL